jgi:hypothetical protein
MNAGETQKRLTALKRNEWDKLEALTKDIVSQSRAPLETLADVWASSDADERRKTARVLSLLEELAIRAWLGVLGRVGVTERLEAAEPIVAAYRATQDQLLKALTPLLDDTTALPPPRALEPSEERRPPTRVCDEAYLLLRRLRKADEGPTFRAASERAFLLLTDRERSREIKLYQDKQLWSSLAEPPDEKEGR